MFRFGLIARILFFLVILSSLEAQSINWNQEPHPRLFLNPARIQQLKSGLDSSYKEIWSTLQQRADEIASRHPPAYSESRDRSGTAMWWEMTAASDLPVVALAYVVTGNRTYLDAAREWTNAVCRYPHWGKGRQENGDLSTGYLLVGVAVVYDWLYSDLDEQSRSLMRQALIEHGRGMFEQSGREYWKDLYLQNHLWVSLAGLAAAAGALQDDPQIGNEASEWMSLCLRKFEHSEGLLSTDGASQEGLTYWSVGLDGLLKFWNLSADLLGKDVSSQWWAKTGYYRLYLSLPFNAATADDKVVDFADCIRADWIGPDYLVRRLAAMNHDSHLQWLGNALAPISICRRFGSCWLNLIWYDPSIPAAPPTDLPTMHFFENMGIVSSRSDWSGNESLLAFKCGPVLGRWATQNLNYDPGAEHVHPDANHFVLFGNGEWLIRDDGYRAKGTDDHNTLLVDGNGQLGEGSSEGVRTAPGTWGSALEEIRAKSDPHVITATSTPQFDYIAADAAQAYPAEAGINHFVRQVVFLKPNTVIIADDIQASNAHELELRFHPQFSPVVDENGSWVSHGEKAALRLTPFVSEGVQLINGSLPARPLLRPAQAIGLGKNPDAESFFTIQYKFHGSNWRCATALTWSEVNQAPALVTVEKRENEWSFHAGDNLVRIHWDGTAPEVTSISTALAH